MSLHLGTKIRCYKLLIRIIKNVHCINSWGNKNYFIYHMIQENLLRNKICLLSNKIFTY